MFVQNKFATRNLIATLVLLVLVAASSDAFSSERATLTFTQPGTEDTIVPALDDFATTVIGDPWDMNEPTDLWAYRGTSNMVNSAFANGLYTAQMTEGNGSERVMLLTAGATNNAAMRVGKTGYAYPINANKYRYLSYRFYKSNTNCNSSLVMWYGDDSRTPAVTGVSNSFPACETPQAGWHTKVIDLATIGIQAGEKEWSGTIRELILKPFAGPGANGATFKLDWVRLTSEDPRGTQPYTLLWTSGDDSQIDLYASQDQVLDERDILIATDVDGSQESYTFPGGKLFPGEYYIAAVGNQGIVWSPGRIIVNTPPQIIITKPSMISGQAYAATEAGNAWDMNDSSDLNDAVPAWWETCVSNESMVNGIYSASITGCSNDGQFTDAKLLLGHMNPPGSPDPTIDTDKYRYFSFRYRLHGEQNIREGWVLRFGWWQVIHGHVTHDPVLSRDIMLMEGWNTYKVDLWAADVVDEHHPVQRSWRDSAPNRLRFDPSELFTSRLPETFELDWIKITAMDEVARGNSFTIEYEANTVRPAAVTFYYDSDTNPANGRNRITTMDVNTPATSSPASIMESSPTLSPTEPETNTAVYLPLTMNQHTNCDDCVQWSTDNVAPGQYYICAEIDDGYNSTYRCSESPVLVR